MTSVKTQSHRNSQNFYEDSGAVDFSVNGAPRTAVQEETRPVQCTEVTGYMAGLDD